MSDELILDPRVFLSESIDPETGKLNDHVHETLSRLPPTYTLDPKVIRAARDRGEGLWPVRRLEEVQDRVIPGPAGEVSLRVFIPENPKGVYLHIHGGGFMLGRASHSDESCFRIAKACQVATVSVDYRLAPENPFPAGLDDCEAAAVWLAGHMVSEFGIQQLLIGGESAGATLSVATMVRMRDRHGYRGFVGANLVYGAYDLSGTPSARNFGEEKKLVLTSRTMEWFHENYAPREKWTAPLISPLYADLNHLPRALFTVGTLDPLLDDSLFMAARWVASGNKAELAVYPGGIHTFNLFPLALAEKANNRIMNFIKGILDVS
jgi:acetyl esterase/lipase